MAELRREYPILCPYKGAHITSILTAGPPAGGDYTKSGEALFDLVWSQISGGTLSEATELARQKNAHAVELLEAAKRHAEKAPEPCAEKGEMVVKVLFERGDGWSYFMMPGDRVLAKDEGAGYIGTYRVSAHCYACGAPLSEALAAIRDAGGTCLAGEPLPEKVEQTFPWIRRPDGEHHSIRHCSQCLYSSCGSQDGTCPGCKALLKGEVPWTPFPANKGC